MRFLNDKRDKSPKNLTILGVDAKIFVGFSLAKETRKDLCAVDPLWKGIRGVGAILEVLRERSSHGTMWENVLCYLPRREGQWVSTPCVFPGEETAFFFCLSHLQYPKLCYVFVPNSLNYLRNVAAALLILKGGWHRETTPRVLHWCLACASALLGKGHRDAERFVSVFELFEANREMLCSGLPKETVEELLAVARKHGLPEIDDVAGQERILLSLGVPPLLERIERGVNPWLQKIQEGGEQDSFCVIPWARGTGDWEVLGQMLLWAIRQGHEEGENYEMLFACIRKGVKGVTRDEEVVQEIALHLLRHWRQGIAAQAFRRYVVEEARKFVLQREEAATPFEDVELAKPKKRQDVPVFPISVDAAVHWLLAQPIAEGKTFAALRRWLYRRLADGSVPSAGVAGHAVQEDGYVVEYRRFLLDRDGLEKAYALLREEVLRKMLLREYMEQRGVKIGAARAWLNAGLKAGKKLEELWEEL